MKRKTGAEKEKASLYKLKAEIVPSFLIILLGSLDAITTVVGVLYFEAAELNPLMNGIVNTSILAFLVLKICGNLSDWFYLHSSQKNLK